MILILKLLLFLVVVGTVAAVAIIVIGAAICGAIAGFFEALLGSDDDAK